VYVVDGESVGSGIATYGAFLYTPYGGGVAKGVGNGDGAEVGAPNGTFPDGDDTTIVRIPPGTSAPCSIISPTLTGTFVLPLSG
jgi:hypothetical protein